MPFLGTIDPSKPGATDELRMGDDVIRALAAAVLERLADIFVDVDAQPLVIKPGRISAANLAADSVEEAKVLNGAISLLKLSAALQAGLPKIIHAETVVLPAQSIPANNVVIVAGAGTGLPPGAVVAAGVPLGAVPGSEYLVYQPVVSSSGVLELHVLNLTAGAVVLTDDISVKAMVLGNWP